MKASLTIALFRFKMHVIVENAMTERVQIP